MLVKRSPRGFLADELARALHVEVQDALYQLTQKRRVTREMVSGLFLYTAADRAIQRGQLLTRRTIALHKSEGCCPWDHVRNSSSAAR